MISKIVNEAEKCDYCRSQSLLMEYMWNNSNMNTSLKGPSEKNKFIIRVRGDFSTLVEEEK